METKLNLTNTNTSNKALQSCFSIIREQMHADATFPRSENKVWWNVNVWRN